tara:strand:- start:965 stop:1558 length:594 start_codon:yes stop_codon:yes gene_type:complete
MIKRIIWPLIHLVEFNPKIKFNQWGWISQREINRLNNSNNLSKEINFCQKEFLDGAKIGYQTIYDAWKNKVDFTNYEYTVPKLSLALNYLNNNSISKNDNINLNNLKVKILDSRIEPGLVKNNSNFLGLWDKKLIKQELIAGAFGPENIELWDRKPLKQTVRVMYETENRIDIWEWERCLTIDNYKWCVSNINQIII